MANLKTYFSAKLAVAMLLGNSFAPLVACADDSRPGLKINYINAGLAHVQAGQIPLSSLLTRLAETGKFRLHYIGNPPARLISADCLGGMVKELMECLTGSSSNVIAQYSPQGALQDLWFIAGEDQGDATAADAVPAEMEVSEADTQLFEQARAEDSRQRKEAITRLGDGKVKDQALVNQVLHAALNDASADVRAEAIRSLGRIGNAPPAKQLLELMSDPAEDVRLAAASQGFGNPQILTQALSNDNQQVRYAAQYYVRQNDPSALMPARR